ncbi:nickel ABC transporter permease [Paenibacillus sp. OSY-SE]|uniref:nickel ABC transporter permease n=1 Tax=Paenibacillus sp. OSY-SE TaxID=1196323 RepID=UPI0002F648D4|nr:nickel ABC transporter permease [Paenibacillus sp. OSY-SE]
MNKGLLKRLIWTIPTLLGVTVVTFTLVQLMPGNPTDIWLRSKGIIPDAVSVAEIRRQMGLDQPLIAQYGAWLNEIFHLRLGLSFQSGLPVTKELAARLPATLRLMGASFAVACILAVPAGIVSAWYKQQHLDHAVRFLSILGASLPHFWIGAMLIYLFCIRTNLLPMMGDGGIMNYIMPSITMAAGMAAVYARMLRAGMLEAMADSHYKAARARGIKQNRLIVQHAIRPALLPFITVIGNSFGYFWGSSIIVEAIFSWPGVGRLMIDAIFNRDYPVIQAIILLTAACVIVVNLAVDLIYYWLDPRIRAEGGRYEEL